jgi:hypothetical protein
MTKDNLGKRARTLDFVSRTMPLPVELQVRCPALSHESNTYCYLKGRDCDCPNFRSCVDYIEVVLPAIDRRRYR